MKKLRVFIFMIIMVSIIYIPVISIGDVNNKDNEIVQANIALNNKNIEETEEISIIDTNIKAELKKAIIEQKEMKQDLLPKNETVSKLTFEIKEIHKYNKPLEYKIKYPLFNNKDIEDKINEKIKNLANDFKNEFSQYEPIMDEEKFIFNLDTDMYMLKDNLLFVKFYIQRNYNTYPNPIKFYETYIIDIKSGNFLEIKDIFNKGYEYLFYICAKEYFFNNYGLNITKQSENYNDIKPDKEIYRKLFLKDDYVEIFFYDYKKQEEIFINIPFEKILPYINKKYLETTTITTTETTTETTTISTTKVSTEKISSTTDKVDKTEQTTNGNNKASKRKIDKNKPMIALTFDDGPNSTTTNKILDILEKNNSVATFFVVSRRIEKDTEILKRMDSLGCQIGNHTANHKDLTKLSKDQIKSEVDIVNDKLKKAIGKEASMVRVPYGATNDTVKQAIDYPIIMWNVDTKDWQSRNAKSIEKEVLGNVKDGDIILMHDLYDSTAQACEVIIPKLIEQGFQLVTVEELLEYKGIEAKNGTKYFNANTK